MTDVPIAGWYPDPRNSAAQWRWWDGRDWTPDTAPRANALPARARDWGWDTPRTVEEPAAKGKAPKAAKAAKAARPAKAERTAKPAKVTDWTSANTPWIWVLAFSPFIYGIVVGGIQGTAGVLLAGQTATLQIVGAAAFLAGLIPLIVFAELDGRALRAAGFPSASSLWIILLAPLFYFVVRGRKLRKVGARSRGPELVLFLIIALQIVSAVLVWISTSALLATLAPNLLG